MDPGRMWQPQEGIQDIGSTSHGKRRAPKPSAEITSGLEELTLEAHQVGMHAKQNIPHKDQLATFVPWQIIAYTGQQAKLFNQSFYHQATSSKMTAKAFAY